MKNIILLIKGFIIGIANIIPGVSGGTLMITLGIYEDVINMISHFFNNFKKNLEFAIPVGMGGLLAILLMSKVLSFALDEYPFSITLLFIGLILGGIPVLFKKIKNDTCKPVNFLIMLIPFLIILMFTFMSEGTHVVDLSTINFSLFITLFLIGVIAAATMIIPGISGSFILMLLGFYEPILNTVKDLTNFSLLTHNFSILIPFGIGVLTGAVLVAKIIEYLFKKFEVQTYFAVIGFVLASIISIIKPLLGFNIGLLEIVISVIMFMLGIMVSYKLGEK